MILRRYMTQQVATTTAMVVGFLTILLLGGRLIRYFGIAAEGRLDVGLLFVIIGYNLPYFLELILPLSFFIGLMLVFGRLYVDHEMAVLNSSGLSRGSLARLIIPLIGVLFFVEAGLSLVGKPWGVRNADTIWQQQSLRSAFDLIRPQSFISNDDYHLYVGDVSEDRAELQDVILVQTGNDRNQVGSDSEATASDSMVDKPHKDVIVLAKRALQVPAANDSTIRQLDLYQGRRYEIDASSRAYNQVSFERYRISFNTPVDDTANDKDMTIQPLQNLWMMAFGQPSSQPIQAGNSQNVNAAEPSRQKTISPQQTLSAQAELGYRLALPWLMILAPMLAVPLAQVPPRQGRWLRLLPAILIFTSCALIIIALKNAIQSAKLGVWAYPVVIVAMMGLSLYLNWASRIHHRVRFGLGKLESARDNPEPNDKQEGRR